MAVTSSPRDLDMVTTEDSCPVCGHIPLEEILRGVAGEPLGRDFPFVSYDLPGFTLSGDTSCNLCILIREAIIYDPLRVHIANTGHAQALFLYGVRLQWWIGGAPGGRSAFAVSGVRGLMSHVWLAFGAETQLALPELQRDDAWTRRAYLRPAPDPVLVVGRVKWWVRHCEANHAICQLNNHPQGGRIRGLKVLRLLDVVDNHLVEKTTEFPPQYVALSYVWGAVMGVRLTRANKARMMQPGALVHVAEHAPVTIKDAIKLTRMLGARYLWVDSLCLVQNDESDLKEGVQVMDDIYEQAWLTIVNAGGHDANAGLLSLRPGDRGGYPYREVKPSLFMGLLKGVDAYLKNSVYQTRAWTLQEQYLSRRRLYFVGGRVFFRCRECERCETCEDDADARFGDDIFGDRDIVITNFEIKDPVSDYITILILYSKRLLTNDSDTLHAMAGIMRRVSEKLGYDMVQGLPAGAFDRFLLFSGIDHLFHRHLHLRRRPGFPSWSWAGWRGQLKFEYPGIRIMPWGVNQGDSKMSWLRDGTWIIWYQRLPGGLETLVWNPSNHTVQTTPRQTTAQPRGEERYPTQRYTFQSNYITIPTTRTTPTPGLWPNGQDLRSYPILRFWTLSVWLKIDTIGVLGEETRLLDANGEDCGHVMIDGLDESHLDEAAAAEEPVELILLSRTDMVTFRRLRMGYYVMILEWKDGVAERRGLGRIYDQCLQYTFAPGPMWKEITLA